MDIAILQFLSDGSRGFRRSCCLQPNCFNQIRDPAQVILLELLTCEALDGDRNRGVWLFLQAAFLVRTILLYMTLHTSVYRVAVGITGYRRSRGADGISENPASTRLPS
jgi:hypothetical protein